MIARAARAEDHAAFVRFFAELAIDDPVPDAAKWAADLAPRAFFVEEAGAIVGYGMARPMDGVGHVVHVVVDPAWRGRGVGRAVMAHAASVLRAAGCSEWFLNVKPDNADAIRLYERCGMRRTHRAVAMEMAWADVARLPADGAVAAARALDATSEGAAIEQAFALAPGMLRELASRHYVLLAAFEAERAVAFAGFDPTFPGANPFRVRRPTLARTLLEAMRPHARPGDATVRLVADNDAALADALRAAGAVTKLEFEQMRGAIPAPSA